MDFSFSLEGGYYLEISACILATTMFVYILSLKTKRRIQTRIFMLLLADTAICALVSFLRNEMELFYSGMNTSTRLEYILTITYYFFHNLLIPTFAYYTLVINGMPRRSNKRFSILFFIPVILVCAIVLTNPLTNIYFRIENGVLKRGPAINVGYVVALIYLVIAIIYMARHYKAFRRDEDRTITAFIALSVIGGLIQMMFPAIHIELFAESLALLGLLLTLENGATLMDNVTGVYNSRAFNSEIQRLYYNGQRYHLICVTLPSLRGATSTLDIASMEKVLRGIAQWLNILPYNKEVYHAGNGHFILLYRRCTSEMVTQVATRIREKLRSDWPFGDVHVSFSDAVVTLASIPRDFESLEDINAMIDISADAEPESRELTYSERISHIKRQIAVEKALRSAIDNRTFDVHYHPIYSVENRRIVSAEALVRLKDPQLGMISPEEFIPIAEKNDLVASIDEIVLIKVCEFIRDFHPQQYGIEYIEVNLSVYELMLPNITFNLQRILNLYHVPVSFINLETTETATIGESQIFYDRIEQLLQAGFKLSLDDYGTGYSNLSRVMRIHYTNIKIDKSLLWDGAHSERARMLHESTIASIRSLGFNTIQEGVETHAQFEYLIKLGCNYMQGYYFSKPLDASHFIWYMEKVTRLTAPRK